MGGSREGKRPSDAFLAAELGGPLAGDRLDPTEGFLDATDALARSVAGMARGTAVGRQRAVVGILCHMRRVAFTERGSWTNSPAS